MPAVDKPTRKSIPPSLRERIPPGQASDAVNRIAALAFATIIFNAIQTSGFRNALVTGN
ncbi:MAG: hypothetical protein OXI01_13490 [Albidovulum sp.]|nr:hypothetical protein [Albidovulum sp.]